jgi:SAM-dependent methyltransferase
MPVMKEYDRMTEKYLYFGNLYPHERQYKNDKFVGLSLNPRHEREIKHNALDPLPFPNDSIQKIQSQDVFEHLPFDAIPGVLDEVYRVLKQGGVFRLSVPDYRSSPLRQRTVYNDRGEPLADLMMGSSVAYDHPARGVKVKFLENGDAHLWFPRYELMLELIVRSHIRKSSEIVFYQYFIDDERFVCKPIPENEMFVMRCEPNDARAKGKPISIVVDFFK